MLVKELFDSVNYCLSRQKIKTKSNIVYPSILKIEKKISYYERKKANGEKNFDVYDRLIDAIPGKILLLGGSKYKDPTSIGEFGMSNSDQFFIILNNDTINKLANYLQCEPKEENILEKIKYFREINQYYELMGNIQFYSSKNYKAFQAEEEQPVKTRYAC